ncbi:hypothetical protein ACQPZG_02510 (plasmid) [Streptomyces sp. CA-294286]
MTAQQPARGREARQQRSAGTAKSPRAEHDDPVAVLLGRVRDALTEQNK